MAVPQRWAVVVNPTKFDDLPAVRTRIERACRQRGWPTPAWYETTAADPGRGQAEQALSDGAELVCSLGGDGTVRAVVTGLLGSGVPMGLLPGGTGNLLARNLKLPTVDLEAALVIALTGRTDLIDLGEVTWDDDPPEVFCVMAGMGLDADIMAGVDESLKRKVGWWAYVVSGVTAIFRLGFAVRVRTASDRLMRQHARMVLVGNCGELTGGVQLIPEAKIDDGILDVVLASPRSLSAWLAVGLHLVTGRRRGHTSLVHLQDEQVSASTKEPVEAQLDGDAVGLRRNMVCRVLPKALPVRRSDI